MTHEEQDIALINQALEHLLGEVETIKQRLDNKFVSRGELDSYKKLLEEKMAPLRMFVYGTVGLICIGFGAGLLTVLTWKSGG